MMNITEDEHCTRMRLLVESWIMQNLNLKSRVCTLTETVHVKISAKTPSHCCFDMIDVNRCGDERAAQALFEK